MGSEDLQLAYAALHSHNDFRMKVRVGAHEDTGWTKSLVLRLILKAENGVDKLQISLVLPVFLRTNLPHTKDLQFILKVEDSIGQLQMSLCHPVPQTKATG